MTHAGQEAALGLGGCLRFITSHGQVFLLLLDGPVLTPQRSPPSPRTHQEESQDPNTGHGLGLETHEPPYIVEGNLELLEPGTTFTVEPGIYIPGVGGVRIEDNVVVTEDGSQTLTTLPWELIQL